MEPLFPLALARIRVWRLRRYIAGLGPFYSTIAFLIFCLTGGVLYFQYQSVLPGLVSTSAILGAILFIHTHRADIEFGFHMIERPVVNFFAEYFLFSIPFTSLALFSANWYLFPIMVLGMLLIAGLRITPPQRTLFPHLSMIVPPASFEWISGMRKNAIQVGLVLATGLVFSGAKFLPMLSLWLFTAIITSFYQECEPMNVLLARLPESSGRFLWTKIVHHSMLLMTAFLPILIINGWFHPELLWLTALFAVLQLCPLCYAILLKYSRYEPGRHLPGNSIPIFVAYVSVVLPFLLPVTVLMSARSYRVGTKNLAVYFNG